jgi:hypothetical protein
MGYRMPFQPQDMQLIPAQQGDVRNTLPEPQYDTMQGDQGAQALNAGMQGEMPVQSYTPQQQMQGGQQQVVTTEQQVSPEFASEMANIEGATEAQKEAMKRVAAKDAELADAQATMAERAANETLQSLAEQEQRRIELKSNLDAQEQKINTAKNEFQNSGIDGMRIFRDNNQNKIIAVLGMALGGMGAAMTGGKNYAADMLNTIIDSDINQQKYEAEKKGTMYSQSLKERDIINNTFDHEEDRFNVQKLQRLDAIKSQGEAMMSRIGGAKQKELMAATLATIDQKLAETKANLYQNASKKVETTTKTGGPAVGGAGLTEAQAKANTFANAMGNANKQMEGAEEYAASAMGATAVKWVPEIWKPEKAKMYQQAANAWQEAYLRFASGAALADSEIQRTIATAMPAIGDTAAVLKQKRDYRIRTQNDITTGVIGSASSVRQEVGQKRYMPGSATKVGQ